MSRHKTPKGPVPEVTEANIRHQKWVSRAYAFAGACIFALAIAEVSDYVTPLLRTLLMLGIGASGTVAWIMQAKRKCSKCDQLYGYNIRIVNANVCRHCGAEFPKWMPGHEDHEPGQK